MSMLTAQQTARYQRQISLSEVGEVGQERLLATKVLMIGAGGLGCPLLQYLAGAGVGTLGIVDEDVIALDNLHRQVIYTVDDLGLNKAAVAGKYLARLNPDVKTNIYTFRLTTENALELFSQYDIIVDGTDNFATRYLINDACVILGLPLVYGAVSRFEGQVAVFNVADADGLRTNYRDVFPEPPLDGQILNCEEAGVLGVLPGIIGVMQANEVIKIITGIGSPLINQLLTYNARNNQIYTLKLKKSDKAVHYLPKTEAEFKNANYALQCAGRVSEYGFDIDVPEFQRLIELQTVAVIDVRELHEEPSLGGIRVFRMPLSTFEGLDDMEYDTFVFVCQSGVRSRALVSGLSTEIGDSVQLFSLAGGVKALHQ